MKFIVGYRVTQVYRIIYISLSFIGALISIQLVFYIGDVANAFMAFPNLIALFALSRVVARTSRELWKKYKTLKGFEKQLPAGARDAEP